MTSDQAAEVVNKAQAAFPAWAAPGPNARREMLTKAAAALTSKSDAFAEAMMAVKKRLPNYCKHRIVLVAQAIPPALRDCVPQSG